LLIVFVLTDYHSPVLAYVTYIACNIYLAVVHALYTQNVI